MQFACPKLDFALRLLSAYDLNGFMTFLCHTRSEVFVAMAVHRVAVISKLLYVCFVNFLQAKRQPPLSRVEIYHGHFGV